MSIGKDCIWVSTVARATSFKVNNNLRVKGNWSWSQVLHEDVESVSKGGSGSLSPA